MKRVQNFSGGCLCKSPFEGNPAAVYLLFEPRETAWMQALAAEMNLSETAFLLNAYHLHWFTPP